MIDPQKIKIAMFQRGTFLKKAIMYMINSNARLSVNIAEFLKIQRLIGKDLFQQIIKEQKFMSIKDKDARALKIALWCKNTFKYVSDNSNYSSIELWADVLTTWKKKSGDCEDVSIFMFCLLREADFTEFDVHLIAGNVWDVSKKQYVGHCWVSYLSDYSPTTHYFLDWCYYPLNYVNWYQLRDKKIINNERESYFYKEYWFLVTDKDGWD